MKNLWFHILILLFLAGNSQRSFGQNDTLTVGIYHNPPFVIKTAENDFEGSGTFFIGNYGFDPRFLWELTFLEDFFLPFCYLPLQKLEVS